MSQSSYSRQFVTEGEVLNQWEKIEVYFDRLRDYPIESVESLERWLIDYSELMACIEEVGTDRHVKMTCKTDDPDRKAAFLDFIENIDPHCKPRCHELNIKYTDCPYTNNLAEDRYHVLDRSIRATVELFRENNVPLETEEARLSQQYQEISGAQMVEFDGKQQTLQQLALYAESTDRDMRQSAWEVESERRLQDANPLEDIFDQMIKLRHQIAQNADCKDYREYAFKSKQRFDYTPEDCLSFHEAIEKTAVPVLRAMQVERNKQLGIDPLRPWDAAVDVKGRDPLRPFTNVDELCEKTSNIFHRVDLQLGEQFDEMQKQGYLDLASRKAKAPGGYQATYEEHRHPFIFMNAVGVQRDVRTLLHEGGHAFHCYAARHDPILPYRSSPIEFAEVASFGMEMLTMEYLDEFYDEEELARAQRAQLEGIVGLFPWVATVDAFQHFLYTKPDHTHEQRRAAWLALRDRFGGTVDYSGYEETLAYAWQRQLHLYEVPFYYIEYGIAKLGALQVWANAMADRKSATAKYRQALALGGSHPLPTLFEQAGAKFDFSYETMAPLMELIQQELEKLPA